jgi:hydrogenase maturation factor
MTDDFAACELTDGCITCGDVAVVLVVVEVNGADALCCDDEWRTEVVALELVGDVMPGDRLLVHAGVALERLAPVDVEGDADALRR